MSDDPQSLDRRAVGAPRPRGAPGSERCIRESALLSRQQGRAPRSWAAPPLDPARGALSGSRRAQAGKASSRCLDFRIPASGWPYSRWIDRTGCAREIAARARRFPCARWTACYEGSLATHPVPAGVTSNRGLLVEGHWCLFRSPEPRAITQVLLGWHGPRRHPPFRGPVARLGSDSSQA